MNTSKTLIYDGSFNGFLTPIIIPFEQKINSIDIQKNGETQNSLFTEQETIFTNIDKAKRVWNGIKRRNNNAIKSIYFAFLSEQKGIEPLLYHYIQKLMGSNDNKASDFSDDTMLKINQLAYKVGREKHHMETSVSFQLTKDDIYFANIEPYFNVLPLISKHFRSQYTDQQWIIYDLKRKCGLYYNLHGIELITLDLQYPHVNSFIKNTVSTNEEHNHQELWNNYIKNTTIKSRMNKKIFTQSLPKHFWKHPSANKEAV